MPSTGFVPPVTATMDSNKYGFFESPAEAGQCPLGSHIYIHERSLEHEVAPDDGR
jgi:hypothetical protein